MQEFLTNNTVSCNLMSLTGYRTLVIFQALLESPKTNDEINDCLLNNQYIGEKFSSDTLRIYINSLRAIGCEITRANKSNNKKYVLTSHPFAYDIPKSQIQAIVKLGKSLHDKIDVKDVIDIENLFLKLYTHLQNINTKDFLKNASMLKYVNRKILNDLMLYCKDKNQITFLYNSPKAGEKKIELIADKLSFKSEKLYLWGNDLTHKEYSYFSVERILQISNIKLLKDNENFPSIKVVYEVYNHNNDYILEPDEQIIKKDNLKLVIEANARNEFSLMQRILYLANNCKIIEPETFKIKLLNKLNSMEKNYENI